MRCYYLKHVLAPLGQLFRPNTTYEDLFYLTYQLETNGDGRNADITINSFADFLRRKASSFLKGKTVTEKAADLHVFSIKANRYIENKTSKILYTKNDVEIHGLDLIIELANNEKIKDLNILTLNHDTLIEQLFIKRNVSYSEGFGEPVGDIRWYIDDFRETSKIKLIKLNGPISWWRQFSDRIFQPLDITNRARNIWRDKNNKPINGISRIPSF